MNSLAELQRDIKLIKRDTSKNVEEKLQDIEKKISESSLFKWQAESDKFDSSRYRNNTWHRRCKDGKK